MQYGVDFPMDKRTFDYYERTVGRKGLCGGMMTGLTAVQRSNGKDYYVLLMNGSFWNFLRSKFLYGRRTRMIFRR